MKVWYENLRDQDGLSSVVVRVRDIFQIETLSRRYVVPKYEALSPLSQQM